MKKLFISALSMLAVAMGFTACTSDDDVTSTPETPKQITVYATTEQPSATRTSLSEGNATDGYAVLWSADDQMKIGPIDGVYADFMLMDGAGETSGTFIRIGGSQLKEGTFTAYYPAGYDGTSWPTAQTYVANNIPDGVPMKAEGVEVDGDGNVAPILFKNEGGILRLNLKGEAKVTSITISATDLDAITLSCGTGVQLNTTTATPFYIAVPGADPGTAYSGLKIVITDDAGKVCTKTAKVSITVQRSMITDITLTASGFKASTTGKAKATIGGSKVDVNWVQLWENGPKFAEYNVGATSATDFGGYYTTSSQSSEWGDAWRMPTSDEFNALLANCTCTWDDTNKGLLCIGKGDYVSNSIFLPAAGGDKGMNEQNSKGYYWSSTSNNYLKFDSSSQSMNSNAMPYYCYSVRKVLAE